MANKPLWFTFKVYLSFLSQQVSVCFESTFWLLVAQASNTERQVLGKRKDSFTEEASSPREKVDSCSQRTSSPLLIRGWELLEGNIRGAQWNLQGYVYTPAHSGLTVFLKLVMQWSDRHHLNCFQYTYSSVPRFQCLFPFPWVQLSV